MTNSTSSPAKGFSKKDLESIEYLAKTGFPIRVITQEEQDALDTSPAHTPGKWFIGTEGEINGFPNISISHNSPEGERTIAAVQGKMEFPWAKANAELIAQAPTLLSENKKLKESNAELLEACEQMIAQFTDEDDSERTESWRKTIEKARQ